MIKSKLAALITSVAMTMSTGAAAMTGFTAVAADNSVNAASDETEHKHCEMCGSELPEGTLPSPLGIYVCSDCRQTGAGGTRPRTDLTTTQTTTATTMTSMPRTDNDVLPPADNVFYFEIKSKDTNDYIFDSYFNVKLEYEDGSYEVFEYSDGFGEWIARKDMNGTVSIISTVNKYKITPDVLFVPFPANGKTLTLYIESNPDYKAAKKTCLNCGKELPDDALPTSLGVYVCDECRHLGIGGTTTSATTTSITTSSYATTYVTATTVPIPGEELSIAVRDNAFNFIGEAKLKIAYDDGTSKTVKTKAGAPLIIKHNGLGGTIKLIDVPTGFRLKSFTSYEKSFKPDTQFVSFDVEDVSFLMDFIVPDDLNNYCEPGEDIDVAFEANGVEILSIEPDAGDYMTLKEWFTASTYPNHEAHALLKIEEDAPTDYYCSYPLIVTYKPYDSEQVFRYHIPITIVDDKEAAVTATTTTTSTTTTTVEYTTTTIAADYMTELEYDDSPMKIGEIRPIMFRNGGTKLCSGEASVECTSPNATITWDGANIVYVYATAPGDIFVYIRESTCAFGTSAKLTVLDEKFTGENTTTVTTLTTTTTFDTETNTTTTSRVTGQGVDLYKIEDIVIAIDETAIEFKESGKYPLTNYSASQFRMVKPGDKIYAEFLCDTYDGYFIMTAFKVDVREENCKVEATKKGDSNCDGDLNMADAVLIMQAAANPDKYGVGLTTGINLIGAANSDIDGSGDITNKDALKIQQYQLGIIKKL